LVFLDQKNFCPSEKKKIEKMVKKSLIIVESPTKAKTLSAFLGKDFVVRSSFGHIRDLPQKTLGVDTNANYEMSFEISERGKKTLNDLKISAKSVDEIILASDPDREGEAIAWHIKELLDNKKIKFFRATFHEITKNAVSESLQNLGEINFNLVDAQKARRVLDRLVGYKLSPLLWKKVLRGISAGRVQSVAVRLISEREEEIKAFKPDFWWDLDVEITKNFELFDYFKNQISENIKLEIPKNLIFDKISARFVQKTGADATLKTEEDAKNLLSKISNKDFFVEKVEKTKFSKKPYAPFTTSTLQQTSSAKLHFSAKQTMNLAQKLFEGIPDFGGLITYHRTDSTNLSGEFLNKSRIFIEKNFGKNFIPNSPRIYKIKSKSAQEAHEAIRPTDVNLTPEKLSASGIDSQMLKLYTLIWQRAVASQMSDSEGFRTTIDFLCENEKFRSNGQVITFEGFLKVWGGDFEDKILPNLEKGESLKLLKTEISAHQTEPPARFNEASLIKTLEELGVGRPSTYASIISVIQERGYVNLQDRKFFITDIGVAVTKFLVAHFPKIVDYEFTAKMEDDLDEIANGKKNWIKVVDEFYKPFEKDLEQKDLNVKKEDLYEESEEICDLCGSKMVIKLSRFGKFLACSRYPECKGRKKIVGESGEMIAEPPKLLEEKCPKCGANLVERKSKKGGNSFIGCSNYPKCKFIKKEEAKKVGEKCPKCGRDLVEKKSRWGKTFIACSGYPECKYIKGSEENETGVKCPECKTGDLIKKINRWKKVFYSCSNYPKCKFITNDLKNLDQKSENKNSKKIENSEEIKKFSIDSRKNITRKDKGKNSKISQKVKAERKKIVSKK